MSDRSNGSYVGMRPAGPNTNTASGVWSLREAEQRRRDSQWPDGPAMPVSLTELLLHFDGANNDITTTDSSPNNHFVTFLYSPVISTAQSKWGGSSLYLDGGWSSVSVPAGTSFAYGTGDFTIEAWIYRTSTSADAYVFSQAEFGTNYVLFGVNSSDKVFFIGTNSGGGDAIEGPAGNLVVANTWHHIAAVRAGGIVTVYCDGVGGTATANSTNFSDTTRTPTVGAYEHSSAGAFEGYIDDLRVKKQAVYTSNFTPPAGPLT